MNDEIEDLLHQVTLAGAPTELRGRVLRAVEDQLRHAAVASSHRRFRPGLAVAASLIAALALNYWVNDAVNRRLARALGPPVVRRQAAEIAADIASITEPSTGRWAYERLTRRPPLGDPPGRYVARLKQMIQELTVNDKDTAYGTSDESPQMDRDRRSCRDHHPFATQCVFRLEHRNTA